MPGSKSVAAWPDGVRLGTRSAWVYRVVDSREPDQKQKRVLRSEPPFTGRGSRASVGASGLTLIRNNVPFRDV